MARKHRASVYAAAGRRFLVVPTDQSSMGVGLARLEVVALREPSDEQLGRTALDALDSAGEIVPHPSLAEFSVRTRAFIQAMGYRSHRRLMAENEVVHLQLEGDTVAVTPTVNEGITGGYVEQRADTVRVVAEPSPVGSAIRAFAEENLAARDVR